MFNIEKISIKISKKISDELSYNEEKFAVINYGIFSFLQIMLSISMVIIVGWITNLLIESLIVSFVISILRKYSGGAHSSTPEKCLLIGTVSSIVLAYLAKYISTINSSGIIFIVISVFVTSYFIIFKFAPVDSKNKPIKSKDKKKRLKYGSLFITTCYLMIIILLFILYKEYVNKEFIVYILCICLGLSWQIFSLTQIGDKFSIKIESFL